MGRYATLAVGQRAELRRTVTEADVVLYAGLSGDTNPAHLDEVWAARSRFGGRIAHGLLVAGYISAALATRLPGPGTIYLEQSLRFAAPVRIGDTVTAMVQIVELVPARARVRLATRCVNQRGEVVLEGEALVKVVEEEAAGGSGS
jgi:3-hydroxybutyryl-CoA dehydratase